MVAWALSQLVYPFCTESAVTGETRGLVPRHWRGLAVIEDLCLGHRGGKWPQGMLRLTKHVHFPSLDAAETLGHRLVTEHVQLGHGEGLTQSFPSSCLQCPLLSQVPHGGHHWEQRAELEQALVPLPYE